MLYYLFGNAMTMIKAGHVEITTLTSYMTDNIWLAAPQLAVKSYLHKADVTSDRGGLLACSHSGRRPAATFWSLAFRPVKQQSCFTAMKRQRFMWRDISGRSAGSMKRILCLQRYLKNGWISIR